MNVGGVITQALGNAAEEILSISATVIAGGVMSATVNVRGRYRGRYLAPFVNGSYFGQNVFCPLTTNPVLNLMLGIGSDIGTLFLEDAGYFAAFPSGYTPQSADISQREAAIAQRLFLSWNAPYVLSPVDGDSQLSDITILGADRVNNVLRDANIKTRASLSYTIDTAGSVHLIRWWAGATCVASGSITGNGSVVCTSGITALQITCTLTYTADVPMNTASIMLLWPAAYQIHWSMLPLTFPRTPQDMLQDDGSGLSFRYLSAVLGSGTYYYNVVPVDDEGVVGAAFSPAPAALPIQSTPAPAVITSITQPNPLTKRLIVHWTVGEAGCTYTVYYSNGNTPVNLGQSPLPAPIVTAEDVTELSFNLPDNCGSIDQAAALATLQSSWNTAIATATGVFNGAGADYFDAAVVTLNAALDAALMIFGETCDISVTVFRAALVQRGQQLLILASQYKAQMYFMPPPITWATVMGTEYGNFLACLGNLLFGEPATWSWPGLDTNLMPVAPQTIAALAVPPLRQAVVGIIVRATKGGVQETNDAQTNITLDNTGLLVLPAPNPATITQLSFTDTWTVNVQAQVVEDNAAVPAAACYLYVLAPGDTFDPADYQASAVFPPDIAGQKLVNLSYSIPGTPAAGWYRIIVISVSAAGTLAASYEMIEEPLSATPPPAVAGLTGAVQSGE